MLSKPTSQPNLDSRLNPGHPLSSKPASSDVQDGYLKPPSHGLTTESLQPPEQSANTIPPVGAERISLLQLASDFMRQIVSVQPPGSSEANESGGDTVHPTGTRPSVSGRAESSSAVQGNGVGPTTTASVSSGADDVLYGNPLEGGLVTKERGSHSNTLASGTDWDRTPASPSGSVLHAVSQDTTDLNTLLEPFSRTCLPPTARVRPLIPTRTPPEPSLKDSWRYVSALFPLGKVVAKAVAHHAMYGPVCSSWGVEMTLFTTLMRNLANFTDLATVEGVQAVIELGRLIPVPQDGLITPVSFKVRRRGLRGFLHHVDETEDGKRALEAEWVVGKNTWKKLQAEWREADQVQLAKSGPGTLRNEQRREIAEATKKARASRSPTVSEDAKSIKAADKRRHEQVVLYFHGGAYFAMSAQVHRTLTVALSKALDCRIFVLNYRLAPATRFPGQLHDCVSSYMRLVEDLGIPARNIILAADSAGGGLALATMLYLRDEGYPLPAGAILFSPWVDLTLSCDSWDSNARYDYLPQPKAGDHLNPVTAYIGEGDEAIRLLTHPYASPLFGDMRGLPPLLIQSGEVEVLRDEGALLAHKASRAGVKVRHEVYQDCVHVFQAALFLDASRKALQSAAHFFHSLGASDKEDETCEHQNKVLVAAQGDGKARSQKHSPHAQPLIFPSSSSSLSVPATQGSDKAAMPQHRETEASSSSSDGLASVLPPLYASTGETPVETSATVASTQGTVSDQLPETSCTTTTDLSADAKGSGMRTAAIGEPSLAVPDSESRPGVTDYTRARMDAEMRHEMENTLGQRVKPSTGETISPSPTRPNSPINPALALRQRLSGTGDEATDGIFSFTQNQEVLSSGHPPGSPAADRSYRRN